EIDEIKKCNRILYELRSYSSISKTRKNYIEKIKQLKEYLSNDQLGEAWRLVNRELHFISKELQRELENMEKSREKTLNELIKLAQRLDISVPPIENLPKDLAIRVRELDRLIDIVSNELKKEIGEVTLNLIDKLKNPTKLSDLSENELLSLQEIYKKYIGLARNIIIKLGEI
ncbi:MAG: hypothetical protein J7L07_08565, partial [Candidatus Odinarchaeota archaeon]|nr:hypothetical protein [Candidatus Odinarchaeota archaeon]